MYDEYREKIIRLMQHRVLNTPISELSNEELHYTFDLLSDLLDLALNEKYTQLDYIQKARLSYHLGEVTEALAEDPWKVNYYYKSVPQLLEKGGFDLSLKKWAELVSLPTND